MLTREEIAEAQSRGPARIPVKFTQCVDNYNPGEIAGFPVERASQLVAASVAVYHDPARQENYERAMAAADVQKTMIIQPGKTAEEVLFDQTLSAMDEAMRSLVAEWLIAGKTSTEALERAQQGLVPPPNTIKSVMPGDPSKMTEQQQADLSAMEAKKLNEANEQLRREEIALAAARGDGFPDTAPPPSVPEPEPVETPAGVPMQDADEDAPGTNAPGKVKAP